MLLWLLLAWLVVIRQKVAWPWLALATAAMVGLFLAHDAVLRAHRRALRLAEYYRLGLARRQDAWSGTGHSGERFQDPAHPYAADLDLFGRGSLFELLCTARTAIGEQRLAAWLLVPAAPAEITRRQAGIEGLRGQLDLREAVAAVGDELEHRLVPDRLRAWATASYCVAGSARCLSDAPKPLRSGASTSQPASSGTTAR